MDKKDIKKILRSGAINEAGKHPHITGVKGAKTTDDEQDENKQDKLAKLLSNDIYNHAAIIRQLHGEPWEGNDEATNRSLFRKQLKREKNDEGGQYEFSDQTIGDVQKILMNTASTINHSLGRQGK